MDVSRRLAAAAVARTALLVVEVPGWAATRFAVERAVRERGWRLALSPADADVLVTCGRPGERFAEALDLAWAQLPGPRSRVDVCAESAVEAALDQAATELLDVERQRRDAAQRSTEPEMGSPPEPDQPDDQDDDQDDDQQDADSSDMDDGDMDHGDMDHGDMEMDMPGGIPLAGGGGDDRDGLDLDVLHVPLGPVLPLWPAGLLLHCTLAGDLVTEARPEILPARGLPAEPSPYGSPADRLDRAAQLLALAGWDDAAGTASRLRDAAGAAPSEVLPALDALIRRIRRSWLLRWSLGGVAPLTAADCTAHGIDPRLAGDARDRLLTLLEEARAGLHGDAPPESRPTPVDALPAVVPGLDLGAARLLVAGLDVEAVARATAPAGSA